MVVGLFFVDVILFVFSLRFTVMVKLFLVLCSEVNHRGRLGGTTGKVSPYKR